ncbi:MAG: hypothetical protein ACTSSO_05505, partial [Candidatus Hodarchaeales archaeon]
QECLSKFYSWIHENEIPVLISCIDTADDVIGQLQHNSIPVFKWPNMTVKAMNALVHYYVR